MNLYRDFGKYIQEFTAYNQVKVVNMKHLIYTFFDKDKEK